MQNQIFTIFLSSVLLLSIVSIPSNNDLISDAFGDHPDEENDDDTPDFIVQMNSDQIIPASDSLATGTGTFQFNENHTQINYQLVLSGLDLDGNQTTGNNVQHISGFGSGIISMTSDTSVDDHDDHNTMSECMLNSLDDLAHEFMNNNAYLNFHTDDGIDPQNTGPGDLATPGEIRGNIGPAGTDTYAATINANQNILDGVDDPALWNGVTATGTAVFLTGHHSDHIDFEITVNDLHNVTGIHVHLGDATENSHIHAVDLLTSTSSLFPRIDNGPIPHMDGTFSGEITVDDLCPGASSEHDDEHDEFVNDGGDGTSDGHDADDVTKISIHNGPLGTTGPRVFTIFDDLSDDEDDNEHHALEFNSGIVTTTSNSSVNDKNNYALEFNSGIVTTTSNSSVNDYNINVKGFGSGIISTTSDTSVDDHDDHNTMSECTLNSLDALAQEFMNNNAYLNFHTDDGVHPQNTGPGDLATPGEIRGNIGPAGTDTYAATINVSQNILDAVADTTPWDTVAATGTAVFLTGHHSDHIDYEITVNDLHNVTGIHVHLGDATENSHIHAVDLLTSTSSLLPRIDNGPIAHMDGTFSGEITVDHLCPGASSEHDDEHNSSDIDDDMVFDASTGTISGIWDEGDTVPLSQMMNNFCSESLYIEVHTKGFPTGAIRGQIIINDSNNICQASSTGFSDSFRGGGGGSRSSIMAPNLILYNSCSDELDGIMRIVTFNQPGLDLTAKLSFKDFSNWAVDVTDKISYLKYIDISNEHYEYSVFDVRFPPDLKSFWVGLYDKKDSSKFIHHLVKIPTDSCLGYEEPFDLKDGNASIIKPIEPLDIPQPEQEQLSQIKIKLLNEEKIAKITFDLITEHNPVVLKFEDPNSLPTHSIFFNGTWDEIRQCYNEGGPNNRDNCAFAENLIEQIDLAELKFVEITKYTPVIQSFEDPESLTYHTIFFEGDWDEIRQCYKDGDSNHRENCAFIDEIFAQKELAKVTFANITYGKPVVNNFDEEISNSDEELKDSSDFSGDI